MDGRGPWSARTTLRSPVGPFGPTTGTSTGAISRSKRCSATARAALRWLARPRPSTSARVIPRRFAIRSAAPNWSGMSQGKSAGFEVPGPLITFAPSPTRLMASMPQAMPTSMAPVSIRPGDQVIGLLRRAALAVDRGRRHLERETGGEPGVARHVRALLAGLGHAAADDLLDLAGVDPRPLHDRDLRRGQQLGRVQAGERAAALADRGPHRFDDHGLGHPAAPHSVSLGAGYHRFRGAARSGRAAAAASSDIFRPARGKSGVARSQRSARLARVQSRRARRLESPLLSRRRRNRLARPRDGSRASTTASTPRICSAPRSSRSACPATGRDTRTLRYARISPVCSPRRTTRSCTRRIRRDCGTASTRPRSPPARPGSWRIGDSFTFGTGIAYGDRFTDLLENAFDDVEVISMAVPGSGHDQQLMQFVHEGLAYRPDHVFVFVTSATLDPMRYFPPLVREGRVELPAFDRFAASATGPDASKRAWRRPPRPGRSGGGRMP